MMQQVGTTLYSLNKDSTLQVWRVYVEGSTIVVEWGKEGGKFQYKKTVCKAKNVGRSNETTPEQQALFEANAKWKNQVRKGYRENKEELTLTPIISPMGAQDASEKPHFIKYPCHVSPKLDGVRCLLTVEGDGFVLNSRGNKTYPQHEHIIRELSILKSHINFDILDGELVVLGVPLQTITSWVKKVQEDSKKLEFHIFDVPDQTSNWLQRLEKLIEIKEAISRLGLKYLKVVDNNIANSQDEVVASIHEYVACGYEGTVIRNFKGLYEFNQKSNDLLKWKLFHTAEALVFDVEEDKNGEGVLWLKDKEGVTFKTKMKGTHKERLYSVQRGLIGKFVTFEYQAKTIDESYQFASALYVRSVNPETWEVEE